MRRRPNRLEQLPEQYFSRFLTRLAEAARMDGEPLVDLGRGNPDVPPPPHVAELLAAAAAEPTPRMHGYAPFRGVPALKEALAARYASEYDVELDPEREIAVLPGTKSALVELALALAEPGETMLLPTRATPTTTPARRLRARASSRCHSTARPAGCPTSARRRATASRPRT